jgi:SAM-dependent methyltransferase
VGDHFSGHAADYARFRPGYPAALFDWLAGQCVAHRLAWDCGTGNGQAALALAERFEQVVASDVSAEQVAQAAAHPRVRYHAAPAHLSGLADRSVDLISIAQALHWFCDENFYAEARRVLQPDGLIAAWTYTLLQCEPALNERLARFHDHDVGPYWPPERRWVAQAYAGMPFPFAEIRAPAFEIRLEWTLTDVLAYLRTWSATQRCLRDTGIDPTLAFGAELQMLWGDPDSTKTIVWPLALRCGRLT